MDDFDIMTIGIIFIVMFGMLFHITDTIQTQSENQENLMIYKVEVTLFGLDKDAYGYQAITDKGIFYVAKDDYFMLRADNKYIFYSYALKTDNGLLPCRVDGNYIVETDYFKLNGFENIN